MNLRCEPASVLRALDQRLVAVAKVLGTQGSSASGARREPGTVTSAVLPGLVDACRHASRADVSWLVMTAVSGAFPLADEIRAYRRGFDLLEDHEVAAALLANALAHARRDRLDLEVDVHAGAIVVNVDFCARYDLHTGIHRVVRETLPRWRAAHTIVATANTDDYSALRSLTPHEARRVFAFTPDGSVDPADERDAPTRLVIPWRGVLVIPEIPDPAFSPYLAAVAEFSGNEVAVIGYDMIPVVSADIRPSIDAIRFAKYLTVIKHAARVAAISVSATTEFAGFAQAVGAQGLPGPEVSEVLLPGDVPPLPATARQQDSRLRPRVLCVGSHEPHKNHRTVLHAAERLWRAGHDFELEFIGGEGWQSEDLVRSILTMHASGRPVHDRGRVTDGELWQAYRDAAFTVFLSIHEGFGLPVVESLACGTPVVTADYGSLGEIAAGGGCLAVDPRDDDAVTEAIGTLLGDRATLDRLREEALGRPVRLWDEYATDLWGVLCTNREPA
jgi:glycosyltransferase involved in cell wall biosynthesis